jgi:hypothetical protein
LTDKLQAAFEAIGGGGAFGLMNSMFRQCELFEEIAEEKMAEYPEQADLIWHSFGAFGESISAFTNLDECVYEHHVREIMDRIGRGENKTKDQQQAATIAELLIGTMQTSLKVPLSHEYHLLHLHLFNEIFGIEYTQTLLEEGQELDRLLKSVPWPSWIDEEIANLRRKCRINRKFETRKDVAKTVAEAPDREFAWFKYRKPDSVQLQLMGV